MSASSRGLLAVAIVSLVPLLAMILFAAGRVTWWQHVGRLVPLAAGALLGAALFHLVPEALHHNSVSVVGGWVLVGAFGFLVVDRALHSRLGLSPATVPLGPVVFNASIAEPSGTSRVRDLLPLLLVGDALHNGLDGMLVAATYLNQPALGVMTGGAVALHELPRELGTFGLMLAAGLTVRQALGFNVGSALIAMAGAAATLIAGTNQWIAGGALGALAAGTFLYLAGALALNELRQEVPARDRALQVALLAIGVIVTALGVKPH